MGNGRNTETQLIQKAQALHQRTAVIMKSADVHKQMYETLKKVRGDTGQMMTASCKWY